MGINHRGNVTEPVPLGIVDLSFECDTIFNRKRYSFRVFCNNLMA